jgi:hypothetical protein
MKLKTWERLYIEEMLIISFFIILGFESWRVEGVFLGIAAIVFVILKMHCSIKPGDPLLHILIYVAIALFGGASCIPLILWVYNMNERARAFFESSVLNAFYFGLFALVLMMIRTGISVYKKYHSKESVK